MTTVVVDPKKIGFHPGNQITLGCNACGCIFQVTAGARARNARLKHLGHKTQTVSNVAVCPALQAGIQIATNAGYGVRT